MLRLLRLQSEGTLAQFFPDEDMGVAEAVLTAQHFVRKHGVGASLPDGQTGEQNGFAIDALNGIVQIRSKCEGPSARQTLLADLAQSFCKVCTWF